jgi:molecular chaperone HscA
VQGVVMVGGSTRMPQVQPAVARFFGATPLTNLNPDEVVALGAAIQANQLAGNDPLGELLLLDVIPLSLGMETMGGLVERIVPRNQTIPTAMAQDFTTYQGRPDRAGAARGAGRARPGGRLPQPGPLRAARHSAHGGGCGAHPRDLHRRCRWPAQRRPPASRPAACEARIDVKPSYGLSDDQIAQHAARQLQHRARRHAARVRWWRRVSTPTACCWPPAAHWQADG